MGPIKYPSLLLLAALTLTFGSRDARAQQPRAVTVCELSKAPDAANHARIRVTGVVEREFERFVLVDQKCPESNSSRGIWLTYGRQELSGAIYCCPGEGGPSRRPKPLVVEGVAVPLVADDVFRRFAEVIRTEPRAAARATLVDTFFASEEDPAGGWRGYGHFGCCNLLVIERVERFEPVTPSN